MKLEHIKNLLHITCNFNTSSISHSFTISEKNTITVECIRNTFVLAVTSSENQNVEYYDSIDKTAVAIHEKIHSYVSH